MDGIQGRLARARCVDRSLNYGREVVGRFLRAAGPPGEAPVVVDLGAGRGDDLEIARGVWPRARLAAVEAMGYHADLLTGKGLDVHRLDIERERLPFEDGSVDVVVANQILEHVKELFWVLHESARVLRVGGVMVVGVPNLASLHNRALLMLGRQPTAIAVPSAHVRGFTRRGMAGLLREAAPGVLEIERFAGSNFYPFPAWLARPLARVMPGMAVSAFFLIRKRRSYSGEVLEYVQRSRFETNYFVGKEGVSPQRHRGTEESE